MIELRRAPRSVPPTAAWPAGNYGPQTFRSPNRCATLSKNWHPSYSEECKERMVELGRLADTVMYRTKQRSRRKSSSSILVNSAS